MIRNTSCKDGEDWNKRKWYAVCQEAKIITVLHDIMLTFSLGTSCLHVPLGTNT